MWAAASFQPSIPWPPNTISTTRPPLRRRSIVVNNNTRSREVKKKGGDDQGLAQAALKSNGPRQNFDAAKSKSKSETIIPSGADVLKALERATAQKAKRKKEKRMETGSVPKIEESQGAPCNIDNVKPLCIKPEWGDRLKEMESRLQELAQ